MIEKEMLEVLTNFGVIPGLFIILFIWYVRTTDRRIKYFEEKFDEQMQWMRARIDEEDQARRSRKTEQQYDPSDSSAKDSATLRDRRG